MKTQVCDISGMGGRELGGYEWGCQVIAARALRFLTTTAQQPRYSACENIIGILIAEDDTAKAMDAFIEAHPKLNEFGMTGAMHQYGVMHGIQRFKLGTEGYLKALRDYGRTDADFFEFDDAEAFPEDEHHAD